MGPTFPDTSPASSPAQSSISASSLKQTLKNHLSAHHVRFFSACQLRILELVSQKRSCVVEGGACEGKTTGMVASLLNEVRRPQSERASCRSARLNSLICSFPPTQIIPAVRGPQVLLVAPTRTAAESLALLPHSFKSILIESFDPREDARKLARGQQHVVIGTPGRFVEMIRAREALQLGGVRWVGVEEGVWDSEAGRAAWDAVRQAGLPEDVKVGVTIHR
jgi:superfamily II DNA/RNA helicase